MSSSPAPEAALRLGLVGLIIVVVAFLYQGQQDGLFDVGLSKAVSNENTIGTFYKVTKVVDGDTLHVNINGADEKVRLIGINTPETVDPRTPVQGFGKEASNRMKELADGNLVRLEYDESQSTRDVYNRLLAYVYLEDGQMLNRKMVAEGYAYEYTYLTPYKYQKEFRELQNLARISSRGLWAKETCNGSKSLK